VATEQELSGFLKSVERRAFKRASYQVRDEEAALDIVQESMMKLAQHYGDRPLAEMPHLFQRILSHAIIDSIRRQKTRWSLFSNFADLTGGQVDDADPLEALEDLLGHEGTQSAQDALEKAQTLKELEFLLMQLPERQREAFLLRYWEEMDLAETAAIMGCSQGSVKTHCFRAVQALSKALKARGYGS
jgi:RNA polymerase sigma-70 factor (ECF subfamily)